MYALSKRFSCFDTSEVNGSLFTMNEHLSILTLTNKKAIMILKEIKKKECDGGEILLFCVEVWEFKL